MTNPQLAPPVAPARQQVPLSPAAQQALITLEGFYRTIYNPEVPLEIKLAAYADMKRVDVGTLPAEIVATLPEKYQAMQRPLFVDLYARARSHNPNEPIYANIHAVLPQLEFLLEQAGIGNREIYENALLLAGQEWSNRISEPLAHIAQRGVSVQDVQMTARAIDEISELGKRATSYGSDVVAESRDGFKALYYSSLAYMASAVNAVASMRDHDLFSNNGLNTYNLVTASLDTITTAREQVTIDVPQGVIQLGVVTNDHQNGQQQQGAFQFNLEQLLDSADRAREACEERRRRFAERVEQEYDNSWRDISRFEYAPYLDTVAQRLRITHTLPVKDAASGAGEDGQRAYEEKLTAHYKTLIEKHSQMRTAIRQDAFTSMRAFAGMCNTYSQLLGEDAEVLNAHINTVIANYRDLMGEEHPFAAFTMMERSQGKQSVAIPVSLTKDSHERASPDGEQPTPTASQAQPTSTNTPQTQSEHDPTQATHHPSRRSRILPVVLAAAAGVGLAALVYLVAAPHRSASESVPGYVMGDVNHDGYDDKVAVALSAQVPYAQLSVILGDADHPQRGGKLLPQYTERGKQGLVYTPTTLALIDTKLPPQGSAFKDKHTPDGCGDLLMTSPAGKLLLYQGDCKGKFKAPVEVKYSP